MARKPREEVAGGIYHVYARGNDRRAVFIDDTDYRIYEAVLERVIARQGWLCLAYCLMPNHVHLLLETPKPTLSDGMRRLHGDYARTFNLRHRRSGHLFQGRFGCRRVKDDGHLAAVAGYVPANPVAAGLCRRPEDWPWSSHARPRAPWVSHERLLELLSGWSREPREAYSELLAARAGPPS